MKKPIVIVFLLYTNAITLVFSQNFHFEEAQRLDSDINSSGEDFMPLLSPNDSVLFFSRVLHPDNVGGEIGGADIWKTQLTTDGWSAPENNINSWNNKGNNAVLGIHESGKIIYLLNTYDSKRGISFSKKIDGNWSKPESIKLKGLSSTGYTGFYVSEDYNHILISMEGEDTEGDQDLYISNRQADGKWSEPLNLGPTVNTPGFEISPFLTPDTRHLFFASNGHDGFGDADIFVCERLYDSWDVWSAPKNLGPEINSSGFDAYFSMSSGGQVFFSSNRSLGVGMSDIYSSELREKKSSVLPDSVAAMLREANELLKKDKDETRSFLFSFDPNSSEVSYVNRVSIENYINSLPDKSYASFNIQYVESANEEKKILNLKKNRVRKVVTILRSSGIPESSISTKVLDKSDGDMTVEDIEIVVVPN